MKYADDPNLGSADTALDVSIEFRPFICLPFIYESIDHKDAFEAFHAASQLELTCAVHEEEVRVIKEAVGGDVIRLSSAGTQPDNFMGHLQAILVANPPMPLKIHHLPYQRRVVSAWYDDYF